MNKLLIIGLLTMLFLLAGCSDSPPPISPNPPPENQAVGGGCGLSAPEEAGAVIPLFRDSEGL